KRQDACRQTIRRRESDPSPRLVCSVAAWEHFATDLLASPRVTRPKRRSPCSASAATRPARSISRAVSGWTTRGPRSSGSSPAATFGVEIMGRGRELGSLEDVVEISSRLPWVRPVIDFAHLHAVTDGAFTTVKAFHEVLAAANRVLPRGAPFHIHFSDIAYAN